VFTLFVTGMEIVAPALATRQPALERLLARAAVRPLGQSAWAWLATLAGSEAGREVGGKTRDPLCAWPVGPISALGDGYGGRGTWLRVEPLGADPEGQGGFRLRAAGLGITPTEAAALAGAFNETFAGDGLCLEIAAHERWYLVAGDAEPGRRDWRGFEQPAAQLPPGERPAPPEPGLRRLLSEVELLFHAHPVNEARRARGMAAIAGLHPWGGGKMPARQPLPVTTYPAGEEPYLAGLRRLGALPATDATESVRCSGAAARKGGVAWPVPIESMAAVSLERIEADWAVPLLAELRRGRLDGLRIIASGRMYSLRPVDAWSAWRRPRALAELA
jgi:hypothetical protein